MSRILLVRSDGALDAATLEDLESQLRTAWRARGARVEAPPPARPQPPSPDVRARLDAIWPIYHGLQLDLARDASRELEAELARVQGGEVAQDLLLETWLLVALVEEASGDAERATAALRRALAARPDLVVDASRFPPTLAERVEAIRAAGLSEGALRVIVTPSDAALQIDGVPVGAGSRTVTLSRGTHWVRAEAPHRIAAGAEVEVGEGPAEARLTLAIEPGAALASIGPPGVALDARAREAIAMLDAAATMLDVTRADAWTLSLVDDSTGRRADLHPDEIVPSRDAARLLDALFAEEGEGDAIWPWLVGAAAVLVAGAVITGALLADQADGWRAIGTR